MQKFIYIALLFFAAVFASAQAKKGAGQVKKSPVTTEKSWIDNSAETRYHAGSTQGFVNSLLRDTCLDKKFSVVFYVIQDSLYSLYQPVNLNPYRFADLINLLNKTFAPICVSFEHCKTEIIPNYAYNSWNYATGNYVIKNWHTEKTLCIYLPTGFGGGPVDAPNDYNYTYPVPPPPPSSVVPVDAIVAKKGDVSPNFLHAVGHYFGLPHTCAEINPAGAGTVIPAPPNAIPPLVSLEHVNRNNLQNCWEHGDGFCDTDADPYPSSAVSTQTLASGYQNLIGTAGLKDGFGDFYLPPLDNIMNPYGDTRCRFTPQQYNYMAYIIMTRRFYLH